MDIATLQTGFNKAEAFAEVFKDGFQLTVRITIDCDGVPEKDYKAGTIESWELCPETRITLGENQMILAIGNRTANPIDSRISQVRAASLKPHADVVKGK